MRALAERWGVGRLLEPAAIQALLDQTTAAVAATAAAASGGRSTSGARSCVGGLMERHLLLLTLVAGRAPDEAYHFTLGLESS